MSVGRPLTAADCLAESCASAVIVRTRYAPYRSAGEAESLDVPGRDTVVNKAELIEAITERVGDKRTAVTAVEAVVDAITRAVAKGERVAITGFGVFEKVDRAARTARNPATGATVRLKKTSVPKFRPGQGFKDVVSGAKTVAAATSSAAKTTAKATAKAAPAAARKTASAAAAGAKKVAKAPAKKAPAKKAATKAPAKKAATKAPAKKAATKAPAKKAATKAPAKKAATKAPAKKAAPRR